MGTQEPKEVNTSNNDIDFPNADEIVKRPVAIPFPQALKASRNWTLAMKFWKTLGK